MAAGVTGVAHIIFQYMWIVVKATKLLVTNSELARHCIVRIHQTRVQCLKKTPTGTNVRTRRARLSAPSDGAVPANTHHATRHSHHANRDAEIDFRSRSPPTARTRPQRKKTQCATQLRPHAHTHAADTYTERPARSPQPTHRQHSNTPTHTRQPLHHQGARI